LTKQCHWALDSGVLRLAFDPSVNQYVVEVPYRVKVAATKANFDLEYFTSLSGPIPKERLPKNSAAWPSVEYLAKFNSVLFSDIL
jgi:hypothetical protein